METHCVYCSVRTEKLIEIKFILVFEGQNVLGSGSTLNSQLIQTET
jgi:hypothetical protein